MKKILVLLMLISFANAKDVRSVFSYKAGNLNGASYVEYDSNFVYKGFSKLNLGFGYYLEDHSSWSLNIKTPSIIYVMDDSYLTYAVGMGQYSNGSQLNQTYYEYTYETKSLLYGVNLKNSQYPNSFSTRLVSVYGRVYLDKYSYYGAYFNGLDSADNMTNSVLLKMYLPVQEKTEGFFGGSVGSEFSEIALNTYLEKRYTALFCGVQYTFSEDAKIKLILDNTYYDDQYTNITFTTLVDIKF